MYGRAKVLSFHRGRVRDEGAVRRRSTAGSSSASPRAFAWLESVLGLAIPLTDDCKNAEAEGRPWQSLRPWRQRAGSTGQFPDVERRQSYLSASALRYRVATRTSGTLQKGGAASKTSSKEQQSASVRSMSFFEHSWMGRGS